MTRHFYQRWTILASAAVLFGALAAAPSAQAFPVYDTSPPTGNGCVSCHAGFKTGPNGPLHAAHVFDFGITECNFCHPNGQGTKPVRTYTSGPIGDTSNPNGNGYGCAGCHGNLYGDTITTNDPGAPGQQGDQKATGAGLRASHAVNYGVMSCGGCHNSDPVPVDENVAPPYYLMSGSNLKNPCFSFQEDITLQSVEITTDSLGLDNDGNGVRDYPADLNCAPTTTTTTTTTTTLPFVCSAAPTVGCIAGEKAKFAVKEDQPGKESIKFQLQEFATEVLVGQFGDPVNGNTGYLLCVYNDTSNLVGTYTVETAGDSCGSKPCWSSKSNDTKYQYSDNNLYADGIQKIQLFSGVAGKGKTAMQGKNKYETLPLGVAAALDGDTSATVQLIASDGSCFGMALPTIKKNADGVFDARFP